MEYYISLNLRFNSENEFAILKIYTTLNYYGLKVTIPILFLSQEFEVETLSLPVKLFLADQGGENARNH